MHIEDALTYGQPREHKRRRPLKLGAKIALWAVLGIVAVALPVGASAWRMYREALAGRQALTAASDEARALDFSAAATDLHFARTHLAAADRFGGVIAPLEFLPKYGSDIRDARALISASLEAATALERVAAIGETVVSTLQEAGGLDKAAPTLGGGVEAFFRLPAESRRSVLAALDRIPADFSQSVAEIDRAMQGFEALKYSDSRYVGPVAASLGPALDELLAVRDRLAKAAEMAKLLPALSGYPDPKTYLLLMQNDTELRPTGGFIGTVGSVTIDAAAARDFQAADVYSLDGQGLGKVTAAPPAPLVKYLGVDRWFLRDANWAPDFPAAAKQVIAAYAADGGKDRFDGVAAIDTSLAADMLRIVGPVKIGSSNFTADNVTDEIEFQVEKGFTAKGVAVAQRKDVLLALTSEVFKRALALPSDRWGEVVSVLSSALDGKHMLVASFDPEVAAYLRARNWDGQVRQDAGDFLMAVDANLAALKTDSVMSRSVGYWIKPDGKGGYVATVDLKYHNGGSFTWKTTRYRTYTRIYVPDGSELTAVAGNMLNDKLVDPRRRPGVVDSGTEFGRQWFGTFIAIEPGETRDLYFSYRLPAAVSDAVRFGSYSLTVQKQPGIGAVPLTLSLDFGKRVARATPSEDQSQWGDNLYKISSDLATDRQFRVEF